MAAADDFFGGGDDEFCVVLSHRVSWMGSGTELCQLLSIFLQFTFPIVIFVSTSRSRSKPAHTFFNS